MTERMSPTVADSLYETRARGRLGMAMAAMMPMIATTISSSMRVKPESALARDISLLLPAASDTCARRDSIFNQGKCAERGTRGPPLCGNSNYRRTSQVPVVGVTPPLALGGTEPSPLV